MNIKEAVFFKEVEVIKLQMGIINKDKKKIEKSENKKSKE
jgi:hypothetical protein